MSVRWVPLPVLPVRAPNCNRSPSSTKFFACLTFGKSLKSSTPSHTTANHLDSLLDCSNSFALSLFANPHPLTLFMSYFYKIIGGRGPASFACSALRGGYRCGPGPLLDTRDSQRYTSYFIFK